MNCVRRGNKPCLLLLFVSFVQQFSWFSKSRVTGQTLLIHDSAKNVRTVRHVRTVIAFFIITIIISVITCLQVFTITYPKQTVSLRYIQLFCIYTLSYMLCYFAREMCFVFLHQHFPQYVTVHNMAVFCSSLISCFPVILLRYSLE